jgi:hypothetical protein
MVAHHTDAESVNLSFSQPSMSLIKDSQKIRFIDLFCGLGGFRVAIEQVCRQQNLDSDCVFSCDIDKDAQAIYQANFGEHPQGDITKILADDIPNHDILMAGFPCQPFSICGDLKGFEDTRGTLFFEIARILKTKQPAAFILENVKQLQGHQGGITLQVRLSWGYGDKRILSKKGRMPYAPTTNTWPDVGAQGLRPECNTLNIFHPMSKKAIEF